MASDAIAKANRPPASIERFAKALAVTFRSLRLYPASSEVPRENADEAVAALRQAVLREPVVQIAVSKQGLFYADDPLFQTLASFASFAREFYARQLCEIRFHAQCSAEELLSFLSLLDVPPEELAASGGFASGLWELGVVDISVREVAARIMEEDLGPSDGGGEETPDWPPRPELIQEFISHALSGRPHDQRLLLRFMADRDALRSYLQNAIGTGGGDLASLDRAVSMLSQCAEFEPPEQREHSLRSVAEAILELEPGVRGQLVARRLLVTARRDDTVSALVQQMSLDEVMESILHDATETPEARAGIARAIRNLAFISAARPREETLEAAGAAMRAHGLSEGFTSEVLQAAAPTRLQVKESTRSSDAMRVESVLRLLDLAPRDAIETSDEDVIPLKKEASHGLSDGDVLASLVAIATLERQGDQLARVVALIEDKIGLLVDEQEFVVAADAAEAITMAEQDPTLEPVHGRRLREMLRLLATPDTIRSVTSALRVYKSDSEEFAACRRLLGVLGGHTISPLLELLAEEQDMTARKLLVDLVAEVAPRFVTELGARIADRRWYFVRNVVNILASTRDPAALPYLGRTLRHTETRVRRETIRAFSMIHDVMAEQLLAAALDDEDPVNVRLAARFLGAAGARGATAALARIATGEGRVKHGNGPRMEAIEALGQIGAPSSLPVLQSIAKQRSLLSGRNRELRAAAEAAVAAIRSRAAQGGTGA